MSSLLRCHEFLSWRERKEIKDNDKRPPAMSKISPCNINITNQSKISSIAPIIFPRIHHKFFDFWFWSPFFGDTLWFVWFALSNCKIFKTLKVRNCHCFVYLSPVCVLEFRHNSCVAAAPAAEVGGRRSVEHRTVREWGHRGDTCTLHQSPSTALQLQIPESR